jgi:hypothetical protein
MGSERWPNLQRFLSEDAGDTILGDGPNVSTDLKLAIDRLEASVRMKTVSECWDFLAYFKKRYDDWGFLRDGFGVSGKPPPDDRGKGQAALSRMKLLYDILAEAIRSQHPDWKPMVGNLTGS